LKRGIPVQIQVDPRVPKTTLQKATTSVIAFIRPQIEKEIVGVVCVLTRPVLPLAQSND